MKPILTRDLYKQIKHYDKQQLENFLQDLTTKAYNRGVSAISREMAERIETGIRNTKGIGEKRFKDLIDNITQELAKGTQQNE